MSISVGSNATSYLSYAGNAYGAGGTASKASPASTDTTDTPSSSSSTSVTLSDEAKAYLAKTAAESEPPSVATLTTQARDWFDQQYAALGTSSAMLDGQVAVDFSGQTRATLSVIADNANGQFSKDEVTAATRTLQSRFNDAMPLFDENPHRGLRRVIDISGDGPNNNGAPVVIARDAAVDKGIVINGLPIMSLSLRITIRRESIAPALFIAS